MAHLPLTETDSPAGVEPAFGASASGDEASAPATRTACLGKLVIEVLPSQAYHDAARFTHALRQGSTSSVSAHATLRFSTGVMQTMRLLRHAAKDADYIAFSLRPQLLWDDHLIARISSEIEVFSGARIDWVLLAAQGRDRNGQELLSAWFDREHDLTPARGRAQIAMATGLLYVVNVAEFRRRAERVLASPDLENFVNAVISAGYLDEVPSYFSARLFPVLIGDRQHIGQSLSETAAFVQKLLTRDRLLPVQEVDRLRELPDLWQCLESAYDRTAELARGRPVFSFVVRTVFKRPHLLARCLISIDYVRRALGIPAEVVIASDVDKVLHQSRVTELKELFPGLAFAMANAAGAAGTSRVRNLTVGTASTTGDRVCIIDDDDYYLPFAAAALREALEPGFDGLLLLDAQVVNEEWTETKIKPERRLISYGTVFSARDWSSIYSGNNSLPLSSVVYPGSFVRRLIGEYQFQHDLSEDFLLHLRVFSDPRRPRIHVTEGVSVHQSHRGASDNVSTMLDRSPWTLDTGNAIYDLLFAEGRQFDDLATSERAARELRLQTSSMAAREHEFDDTLDAARRQLGNIVAAFGNAHNEATSAPNPGIAMPQTAAEERPGRRRWRVRRSAL